MNILANLTPPGKESLACCNCRIVKNEPDLARDYACPICGHAMYNMGAGFIPPRQSDKDEWQKVAFLVQHHFTFEYLSV